MIKRFIFSIVYTYYSQIKNCFFGTENNVVSITMTNVFVIEQTNDETILNKKNSSKDVSLQKKNKKLPKQIHKFKRRKTT